MTITIELEIEETPLPSRRCMRCKATDFRTIKFEYYDSPSSYSFSCSEQSQTSIPMSICFNCKRICMLNQCTSFINQKEKEF